MAQLHPIPPDFLDDAPHLVTTSVDVPATRDELWAAIVDNATWTEWFVDCRSCVGSPPVWQAAGNTRTISVGRLVVEEIAAELRPGERWVMAVTRLNLPIASSMAESLDLVDTSRDGETRTELRWTGALAPRRLTGALLGPVSARMADAWGQSLENLYDFVSARR